jgi:membrane protein DedA with SNARE-associated domain
VPAASVLADLTHFLTDLVGDHGLYAIFLLMLVDAVFPAASEPVMVFGGALASGAFAAGVVLFGNELDAGLHAYLAIALAGTLGYVIGSIGGWAIGRYGGRPFVERHERLLHMSPERIARADRWFDRYDDAFVLVGRVLPVVRSFVAIPAGLGKMPLGRYVLLTVPGSAAWCFGLAGAGWALGAHWEDFHHAFRYAEYAILVAIVAGIVLLIWRWRLSRLARRARAADTAR